MSLFVLVLLPILLNLGFWQLRRGADKQVWADLEQQRSGALAVPPPAVLDDQAFLRVQLTGAFDAEELFLVDNQVRDGRQGYWVVQVLQGSDGRRWLVNRGWIAAPPSRATLPTVATPAGAIRVTGLFWPDMGLVPLLAEDVWPQTWPKRVQRLNVQRMAQLTGAQPVEVRLEIGSPGSLAAAATTFDAGVARHQGYAVQWFGLAAVLLVGFIIFGRRRALALNAEQSTGEDLDDE